MRIRVTQGKYGSYNAEIRRIGESGTLNIPLKAAKLKELNEQGYCYINAKRGDVV